MFWKILPARVWQLGLLSIAGLGIVFYLILSLGAKSAITQQLLRREQAIARAEASNISSFFQIFGDSLAVFAQLSSMKNRDSRTVQDMTVFIDQWRDSGLIGGVVLTDSQGKVQLNANVLGTSDVGASLADRDYFAWAKSEVKDGEYFVSRPVVSRLGATKGQLIVPVAAAVYQNDVFVGALSASVKLAPLTKRYLELMKVSDSTKVYLVDSGGKLLYNGASPDSVGTSIFELLPQLKDVLDTTKEGKLETSGQLVAYSPVELGSQNWFLVMASPADNAVNYTVPIYIRQAAVLLLVSLTFLIFGVVVTREVKKGYDNNRT